MRFRSTLAVGLALALWVGSIALAQVTVPFSTFVAGDVIDPDQVNSNFSALSSQALNRTGGTLTGNLAANANVTVDGADVSDYLDASGNLVVTGTTTFNSLAYTWPSAQAAGLWLRTNGSGTLTWQNPNVETKSATFTATAADDYFIVTATATANLPACALGLKGKWFHIKLTAAATVTLDGDASETIDGVPTYPFSIQYAALSIVCNGAGAWSIF